MMGFLDDYEPVETRLALFWKNHPDGRVLTELVEHDGAGYIVKASVFRDPLTISPDATGLAQEFRTDKGVNSTSALENCETSAIGRALANLGYAAKGKRPSREEMSKTDNQAWQWVWNESKVFKAWGDEERLAKATAALLALDLEKVESMDDARRVFAQMERAYKGRPVGQVKGDK